jgi:TonB-linked SusC/RagA family outer membrane protein
MEKHSFLWFFTNRFLRKLVIVINVSFLITMVGFADISAMPDNPGAVATSKSVLQQLTVSGKVSDASTGEALAGVNIVVVGTTIGAISGANGEYTLASVPQNSTLQFSFIGYVAQSIPVSGRVTINVELHTETTGLEEIVVTGYGTSKKATLTGSVSNIKSEELISTKTLSVASAIQGKIPGVQVRQQTGEPGTFNSRVSVRGFGEPLLVIDGVVRDGMTDFERLNPEDIESISVLKDAAASIYGLGAANGVFIVTTKKGFAGKTEFSLNTMYSYKEPTNDWETINVDAYTMRYMWNEMSRNSENMANYTSDTELAKWKAGTEKYYTDYNWWDGVVRGHVNTGEVTLNARGGNDVITFFSSAGYNNDGGYFKNNELEQYDRYTFRTNVEAKLAKGLKMNVSFYGRYENTLQPTRGTTWTFKRIITNDRGIGPFTLDGKDNYTQVPSENTNVFAELSEEASGYNRTYMFQYQSSVDLNYDFSFIKGLSVGVLGAYDGSITDNRVLYKNFILYDYVTSAPKTASVAPTTIANTNTNYVRKDFQARMAFRRAFGQHNVSAMATYEIKRTDSNRLFGRRQYDDMYTTDIIDQGSLTNMRSEGSRTEQAYMSVLGRFNYDYKSKYLVEFLFREDGTYRYAPGQKWGFFPSISGGWRISQEQFFKNALPIVTELKLRASWGKSGSDAGTAFQYYEGYSFGGVSGGFIYNPGTLTLGMNYPGIVNENLTWVNTNITDLGFDLEMWKGKLGFVFDVFKRNVDGLLGTRASALPNTFGASFPQENLNSQWQQGYDLMISHRNTLGKFSYGISGTLMYTRTYLKHIEQSPQQSTWGVWKNGNDTYNDQGRIQGRVFMNEREGIWTNITELETAVLCGGTNGNYLMLPGMDKIIDRDGNGVVNGDDALPITWSGAGTNPPLQFGANMNASYKGFEVVVNLAGSTLFTMAKSRGDQWGYGTQYRFFLAEYLDRWHTENDTDNPRDPATKWIPGKWEALTVNGTGNTTGTTTDKWRMNATYIRLKTIEFAYNVPAKYTKVIGLNNARVFINGYNLFTICNPFLKDMDPERDEGAFSAGNTYPLMRSYNIGVNIKF